MQTHTCHLCCGASRGRSPERWPAPCPSAPPPPRPGSTPSPPASARVARSRAGGFAGTRLSSIRCAHMCQGQHSPASGSSTSLPLTSASLRRGCLPSASPSARPLLLMFSARGGVEVCLPSSSGRPRLVPRRSCMQRHTRQCHACIISQAHTQAGRAARDGGGRAWVGGACVVTASSTLEDQRLSPLEWSFSLPWHACGLGAWVVWACASVVWGERMVRGFARRHPHAVLELTPHSGTHEPAQPCTAWADCPG